MSDYAVEMTELRALIPMSDEDLLTRNWMTNWMSPFVTIALLPSRQHPSYVHCQAMLLDARSDIGTVIHPDGLGLAVDRIVHPLGLTLKQLQWRESKDRQSAHPPPQDSSTPAVANLPLQAGVVYFLRSGPFVKIGTTRRASVETRISELKTGSPYPITLAASIPGGHDVERQLHHRFRALRQHGEWFLFQDELAEFVRAQAQ